MLACWKTSRGNGTLVSLVNTISTTQVLFFPIPHVLPCATEKRFLLGTAAISTFSVEFLPFPSSPPPKKKKRNRKISPKVLLPQILPSPSLKSTYDTQSVALFSKPQLHRHRHSELRPPTAFPSNTCRQFYFRRLRGKQVLRKGLLRSQKNS